MLTPFISLIFRLFFVVWLFVVVVFLLFYFIKPAKVTELIFSICLQEFKSNFGHIFVLVQLQSYCSVDIMLIADHSSWGCWFQFHLKQECLCSLFPEAAKGCPVLGRHLVETEAFIIIYWGFSVRAKTNLSSCGFEEDECRDNGQMLSKEETTLIEVEHSSYRVWDRSVGAMVASFSMSTETG